MPGLTWTEVIRLDTIAILTGYILDLFFGDPAGRFHPVCLIGKLVSALDRALYRENDSGRKKIVKGSILVITVLAVTASVTYAALLLTAAAAYTALSHNALANSHTALAALANGHTALAALANGHGPAAGGTAGAVLYTAVSAVICDSTLAVRDLRRESMAVCDALGKSLDEGRKAVSRIVGRDTQVLDEEGVIKAAVETVAENTTDGVGAPLFYLFIGGPVAAMVYKAANTMDSMIGYRNERYLYFGRAAARLDDVLNYIPSRLAALFWIAASWLCGEDAVHSFRTWKRDRRRHESPNSAQTESACAGSLGIQLGGDAYYFGKMKKKPVIGDNLRKVQRDDIRRANRVMTASSALMLAAGMAVRCVVYYVT